MNGFRWKYALPLYYRHLIGRTWGFTIHRDIFSVGRTHEHKDWPAENAELSEICCVHCWNGQPSNNVIIILPQKYHREIANADKLVFYYSLYMFFFVPKHRTWTNGLNLVKRTLTVAVNEVIAKICIICGVCVEINAFMARGHHTRYSQNYENIADGQQWAIIIDFPWNVLIPATATWSTKKNWHNGIRSASNIALWSLLSRWFLSQILPIEEFTCEYNLYVAHNFYGD